MFISAVELFKVGIGPSSSHTVAPMKAARRFALSLEAAGAFDQVAGIQVEVFGSLAFTGKGHGTDVALLLGFMGETPESVDVDGIEGRIAAIRTSGKLSLLARREISFSAADDIVFERHRRLPVHSNGMRMVARDPAMGILLERIYYSVGGGFLVDEHETSEQAPAAGTPTPYPFRSGEELLALCARHGLSISTVMLGNEKTVRSEESIRRALVEVWRAMEACIQRGCEREGILPGGLKVRRRAAGLYRRLRADTRAAAAEPLLVMDWVNLWALAVCEENAAGGRVVTAPTNGAAGIIPAVLQYYRRFVPNADDEGCVRFLLTAAAIGSLYKWNASISGAEVGCQGEVGVACSMAAGALTEVLGGTPEQVENAAEIGMEHNLGLTCDPIGGLVQIPCIERNAMGAVKAINAARLALSGDGKHKVSLDKVIATMRQTGEDMSTKYKETARGGLAVNIIEC
jgi:L-serine dehydratase